MNYIKNAKGYSTSLGMCVTLSLTSEPRSRVVAKGPPYHREVTIYLPESKADRWVAIFQKALILAESDDSWPIRIDWQNACQFLSLEEIQKAEQALPKVTFYIYNAPMHLTVSKFDLDALYKAKNREKYSRRKAV